jgi:hypothetical protein
MMNVLIAEASPCCPSSAVGRLLVMAYVLGGALVYLWLALTFVHWTRARRNRG